MEDMTTTTKLERELDLTSYDIIVVNSSSGKDSHAMTAMIAQAAEAQGVLDRVHVVHADLGRAEWKGTKELVEAQARHYGITKVHVVNREKGDLVEEILQRGMWPSSNARYCTSDQKRDQVAKLINRLAREHEATQPRVLNCMGIRAAESPARSKKIAFQDNKRISNSKKTVHDWFPIFNWTVEDVWAVCNVTPELVHPAYAAGMPRLSCVFCVFAPKAALVIAGRNNPDTLALYVEMERTMGHQFRQDLSMADVAAAVASGDDAGTVTTWEM